MSIFRKSCVFSVAIFFAVLPFVASADHSFAVPSSQVVTTVDYVDETTVAKYQGTSNANKMLQVNSSGDLAIVSPVTSINTGTSSDNNRPTTKTAVTGYAIQKPTSAAKGKVLMYDPSATGSVTANSRPVAQYIKIPVTAPTSGQSGDPNTTTPSGFASIWLQ